MAVHKPGVPRWFLLGALTVPVLFLPGAVDPFELPRWIMMVLMAVALLAVKGARTLSRPDWRCPLQWMLLYCFAFSAIHWMLDPSVLVATYAISFATVWVMLNSFGCASGPDRETAARWVVWMGVVQAAYGILQYLGFDPIFVRASWAEGQRMAMAGTIGTPSIYGIFLGLAMLSGIQIAVKSRWNTLLCGGIALMGAALLINNTRAAIAGTLLGMVVLLVQQAGKRARMITVGGLMAAVLFVALVPDLRQRWVELADWKSTHSATIRPFYWKVTWTAILEKPWLGHGPGSFSPAFFSTQTSLLSSRSLDPPAVIQPMLWAHNDYLQIWVEYGLPGILLFILALWRRAIHLLRRSSSGAIGGLCLAAFTALVLFPFSHPSTLIPILWLVSDSGGGLPHKQNP